MPAALLTPGVYVEEIPSGVRTIIGVSTSTTAFVGRAIRGPVDVARVITGPGDFDRTYGGLWRESRLGYSVNDFFRNGGGVAVIVRVSNPEGLVSSAADVAEAADGVSAVATAVDAATTVQEAKDAASGFKVPDDATPAKKIGIKAAQQVVADADAAADLPKLKEAVKAAPVRWAQSVFEVGGLKLEANSPGRWGASLRGRVTRQGTKDRGKDLHTTDDSLFNLIVTDDVTKASESFNVVAFDSGDRKVKDIVEAGSELVRLSGDGGKAPETGTDPWDSSQGPSYLQAETKKIVDSLAADTDPANEVDALRTTLAKWADQVTAAEQAREALNSAVISAGRAPGADPGKIATTAKAAVAAAKAAVDKALQDREGGVSDGDALTAASIVPAGGRAAFRGIYALEKTDIFNLLVIPPYLNLDAGEGGDVDAGVINDAAVFCEAKRAMLVVDPPTAWKTPDDVTKGLVAADDPVGTRSKNAAIFFPRIRQPNPLNEMRPETFTPSGTVAGVMARTDVERGVWKAPAGLDAVLKGVSKLASDLTNGENGELNPRAVNCLRLMPPGRRVVWGARTLEGDDRLASEWKYIPIRRTALFIEESLYRGTQWVVFEPNDEPLWASIRLNVGAFMNGLFRQGAFAGRTPAQAYYVRCDKDTNPQQDIDRGIVNILVGFAPLKPAEFVVIKLQQIAGQLDV